MIYKAQESAAKELRNLADSGRQSILIEGPPGCGKTYLSQQFANLAGIDEYHTVSPKVS